MKLPIKIISFIISLLVISIGGFNALCYDKKIEYQDYHNKNKHYPVSKTILNIKKDNIDESDEINSISIAGMQSVPKISANEKITYKFSVNKTGLYPIALEYCSVGESLSDIEIAFTLDGVTPFIEANRIFLSKIWEYDLNRNEKRFEKDNRGNEIIARQREVKKFNTELLRDREGYFDEAFMLLLEKGEHSLTIFCLKESIAVQGIILGENKKSLSYEQYILEHDSNITTPKHTRKIEAEKPQLRSTAKIYPVFDRSSPDISPSNPKNIMLNIIGGEAWKYSGEWLSYDFDIPNSGFYNISFKYQQNLLRGLSSIRKITIDDKLLFDELAEVEFEYNLSWNYKTLGSQNGEPYKIYLEKGPHTLKLEARLGETAKTLRVIDSAVADLNTIYRKIVMVTGIHPDPYRDYMLDREIEDLVPCLKSANELLTAELERIETKADTKGTESAFFYDLIRQLESFIKDTHNITVESTRLDRFKQNISGLAELLLRLKEQPLALDYIIINSTENETNYTKANLLEKYAYRMKSFYYSFVEDYATLGNVYGEDKSLEVWLSVNDMATSGISSGRDQAEILKRLIDEEFSKDSGINVNLSLVNTTDTLLQAIVGGNNPDAALFVPKGMSINLAMRNALVDLSEYSRYAKIKERFHPSALIANMYGTGVYGIPETQSFNMLFYRKDIFDEMGLSPPQTWEEFYDVTAKLQKVNMQVGVPESQSIFEMLLLQEGGNLYNKNLSKITLTTNEAVKAFTYWTDLYKQYELPLVFDFFNRFRTGEMPMGINSFVLYNQLSVAAPEIRNLWEMMPVPGIATDSGINRAQTCSGSSAIITKASKLQNESFLLIDWWTSEEVQSRFGNELETIMGTAARYNSANLKAFESLKWSQQELKYFNDSRDDVWDIYQTPASYYVERNLSNAFRKVVYYYNNDREVLNKYAKDMNNELERKRKEFGLE